MMRVALTLFAACAATAPLAAQNLYKAAGGPRALVADHRATKIGDILTITIREAHKVTNDDKVNRKNQSSLAARLEDYTITPDTFPTNSLPKLDVRQSREVLGEAKQEKDSSVEASIAVMVVDVQPNGNLVVSGSRLVRVDDEDKTLRISGIVRPLDVSKSNTVSSTQVADARVALTSEGGNQRVTTRGPVATAFDTLIWAVWPF